MFFKGYNYKIEHCCFHKQNVCCTFCAVSLSCVFSLVVAVDVAACHCQFCRRHRQVGRQHQVRGEMREITSGRKFKKRCSWSSIAIFQNRNIKNSNIITDFNVAEVVGGLALIKIACSSSTIWKNVQWKNSCHQLVWNSECSMCLIEYMLVCCVQMHTRDPCTLHSVTTIDSISFWWPFSLQFSHSFSLHSHSMLLTHMAIGLFYFIHFILRSFDQNCSIPHRIILRNYRCHINQLKHYNIQLKLWRLIAHISSMHYCIQKRLSFPSHFTLHSFQSCSTNSIPKVVTFQNIQNPITLTEFRNFSLHSWLRLNDRWLWLHFMIYKLCAVLCYSVWTLDVHQAHGIAKDILQMWHKRKLWTESQYA